MSNKKSKGTKVLTPFGRSGFSCLLAPSTKFNPDGEYNAKVILDDNPETAAFIELLERLYEAAYESNRIEMQAAADARAAAKGKTAAAVQLKRADKPFKRVKDEDTGEELPQWSVNARLRAVRRGPSVETADGTKTPGPILGYNSPVILDSKNKPVHTGVGNGSIIRFEAYARPFFNASLGSGLQMQLIGVQVRELVPFGQTQPTFGEVDGFVESAQAPAAAPAKTPTPATEPVTGDEEDAPWV